MRFCHKVTAGVLLSVLFATNAWAVEPRTPSPAQTEVEPEAITATWSGREKDEVWNTTFHRIQAADSSLIIDVNASGCSGLPWSVMEAIRLKGVGLDITWSGGTIIIPPGSARAPETGRIYWPFELLGSMYRNTSTTVYAQVRNPETGGTGPEAWMENL